MHIITLPGGEVEFYDSAHKLPEMRRVEFDYYALIESGIGSTMGDVDGHFERLAALAGSNDEEAILEGINNVRYLFFNLLNRQVSPRALSLACLVHSLGDTVWTDFSPEGVEQLVGRLSAMGLTDEHVEQLRPDLKKKSTEA